jgi:nicotinamide riboside transporter PnuC
MNFALRMLCLLVYAMALGRLSGLLTSDAFSRSPIVAGVLLLLHVLELIFLFKHVRLYKGSLAVSVVLTLLFGLLHWKPLADEQKRQAGRA